MLCEISSEKSYKTGLNPKKFFREGSEGRRGGGLKRVKGLKSCL